MQRHPGSRGSLTPPRARISSRFAELHHEREQAQTQLGTLAAATPKAADPTLLDELPLAGDILPGLDPGLKARLFDAFDLQILWNKPGRPPPSSPRSPRPPCGPCLAFSTRTRTGTMTLADITSGETADVEDLFESPIVPPILP